MRMNRYRFKADAEDWRPISWPPVGPCWLSSEGEGYSIVVAYARSVEDIRRLWPEASEIELLQADVAVTFSDRFPKPDWWPLDDGDGFNPHGSGPVPIEAREG